MGSAAFSTTKDQRLGIEGDVGQVTAPQSQIANPLGIALGIGDQSSGNALNVEYRDVYFNDLNQVNALVTDIMQQQESAMQSIADLGNDVITQVASAAGELKEPLLKLVPWIAGLIVLLLYLKYGK